MGKQNTGAIFIRERESEGGRVRLQSTKKRTGTLNFLRAMPTLMPKKVSIRATSAPISAACKLTTARERARVRARQERENRRRQKKASAMPSSFPVLKTIQISSATYITEGGGKGIEHHVHKLRKRLGVTVGRGVEGRRRLNVAEKKLRRRSVRMTRC